MQRKPRRRDRLRDLCSLGLMSTPTWQDNSRRGPDWLNFRRFVNSTMQTLAITWLGHSTFILRTPGGRRVLFDPWLTDNPSCPQSQKKPQKVDLILVSHGHFDHVDDLVACARES